MKIYFNKLIKIKKINKLININGILKILNILLIISDKKLLLFVNVKFSNNGNRVAIDTVSSIEADIIIMKLRKR